MKDQAEAMRHEAENQVEQVLARKDDRRALEKAKLVVPGRACRTQ